EANTLMTNFLTQYQDIQGVMAANDSMALGVVKALDAAGLRERRGMLVQASVNDLGFRRWLAQAGPGADDPVLRSRWQALRTEYDHRLDDIFTLRHMSRSSEWSPRRMLSSAFLHADPMH
ncbi:hypothetical protein SB822_55435, partial [Paraburkholderia sp. SIMBA_054]